MVDHPSHEIGGKAEERENDSVGNQFSSLKQALQQRLGPVLGEVCFFGTGSGEPTTPIMEIITLILQRSSRPPVRGVFLFSSYELPA